ncbi:beta-eliminating lyase-related protein, partial [Vibrio parahaemolyticus]|nr:beta-eliminating lyase-related protein [Vibrio parahaemolyticus]
LCHIHLSGNKEDSPAEHFAKMAKWCEENNVNHDVYGEGETIQAFEQKVADLLGYEAGLFVVTGTMTQPTVLEIVTRQKRNPIVAMHASSHIPVHEKQGYQLQHRFSILPVGNPYQTWKLEDLTAWPDEIAAVLYELPMREIGGQLPSWQELEEIKAYCAENKIHLHMDGARLWETAAY